jgi:SRSO17 transposase
MKKKPTEIIETSSITCSLKKLRPLKIKVVDQTKWEQLWNYIMQEYHYLGFGKMLGTRIKYLIFSSSNRVIAAIGFRAASLKLRARAEFINWSKKQRKEYLPQVINNNRFLILPWVQVQNLASHILSQVISKLKEDWYHKYNCRPLIIETFVDPEHFEGTIYKASNWIKVGETSGYTKKGSEYKYHGNCKEIYLYPIENNFREIIGCQKQNQTNSSDLRKHPIHSFLREDLLMLLQKLDWHPKLLKICGVTKEKVEGLAEKLIEFHQYFEECYSRSVHIEYAINYLKGLMGKDIIRKNVAKIANRIYPGNENKIRNMQRHLTQYRWDTELMMTKYRVRLSNQIAVPQGGMLTVDESGFAKDGKSSVGVYRQYCGSLGKVENCQVGVFVGYSGPQGYGLIDRQLYLPKKWFSDEYKNKLERCRVPEELEFMTKPKIAQKLIEPMQKEGLFPARWLGCDSVYGSNHEFLDAVAPYYWYLASVRSATQVWLQRPEVKVPPYKGRGRKPTKEKPMTPSRAISAIAKDPDLEWKKTKLAEGAHGPLIADIACIRVIESRDGLPGKERWLIIRKQNNKTRYYLSNAPEDLPFEELAKAVIMRWPIEQSFKEAKDLLGMDEYECRTWKGWHRHMSYVFLAMLFLLEVRKEFKKKMKQ